LSCGIALDTAPAENGEGPRHREALEELEVGCSCTGEEATKFLPLILPTNNTAVLLHDAAGRKNRHAATRDDEGDLEPESHKATPSSC
jgi:hypothetical protein